jgi:hypothetical protein
VNCIHPLAEIPPCKAAQALVRRDLYSNEKVKAHYTPGPPSATGTGMRQPTIAFYADVKKAPQQGL